MGCGGLVVVGILLVVIIAALGGGGETAGSGGPTSPEDPGEPEQAKTVAGMGATVPVGEVAWQINDASQSSQLSTDYGESKQGSFVIVDFLFQNNGSEAVTLDSSSVALIDGEGRESQVDTDNFAYVDPNKDVFLQQVNPGVSQEGQVIFTVAPDAANFNMSVGDTNMFGGEDALVDLGF